MGFSKNEQSSGINSNNFMHNKMSLSLLIMNLCVQKTNYNLIWTMFNIISINQVG